LTQRTLYTCIIRAEGPLCDAERDVSAIAESVVGLRKIFVWITVTDVLVIIFPRASSEHRLDRRLLMAITTQHIVCTCYGKPRLYLTLRPVQCGCRHQRLSTSIHKNSFLLFHPIKQFNRWNVFRCMSTPMYNN